MTARTFTFNVVAAGSTPAYLSGMADWGRRDLTPSPQLARDVFPTRWRDSTLIFAGASAPGPYDTDNKNATAFMYQSGAVQDPVNKRMYFHGGGHTATCFNGIISFDFNGDASPVGWGFVTGADSAEANLNYPATGSAPYIPYSGPGTLNPISIHTYHQQVFVPSRQRLYRFGGSTFGSGTTQGTSAFYFDLNTSVWTELYDAFHSVDLQGGCWCVLSPDETKVFIWNPGVTGHCFVTLADTAAGHVRTAASGSPGIGQYQPCGARNLDYPDEYLVLGGGLGVFPEAAIGARFARTEVINWASNTVTTTIATVSGPDYATFSPYGAGCFYDQGNHCFWVFGAKNELYSSGTNQITKLWKITRVSAASYAVEKVTLPNPLTAYPPPVGVSQPDSTFSKFMWFEDWRTLMYGPTSLLPMQALKIPTGV